MSKLANIGTNPTLTTYAQGASQSATSTIADFLAPTVPVPTMTGRYKQYDEKNRFHIPNTLRGLGGRATELGWSATDKTYNCSPHALDVPVDMLEQLDNEAIAVMQEAADMAAQMGALSHEQRVIQTALNTVGAGSALSVGSSDDIIDQLDQIALQILRQANFGGMMQIGFLFGANAARVVKNHASVKGRVVSGSKSKFATPSMNDVADMLLLNTAEAQVSLLAADNAAEGLAADAQYLLNGDILIFARSAAPTRRDPSFMKTFRLRDQWMLPGVYQRDDGRVDVAKFDWSADVQVTNTLGGVRKTVALS